MSTEKMTPEKHKERHIALHKALDELVADYITHTKRPLSQSTIMDLIVWSHGQTLNPTKNK